ncbi:MAG: general secretion pathway protein GspB [Burkholderiales bacterium]|jgi:hypothetical protein|nr:general secretion pathway protein GspB [Burkholderiales bacterium]
MKNISILVLLASIASVFAVAAFLFRQESQYSPLPSFAGRSMSSTAVELQKAEMALRQLEQMRKAAGLSLSDDSIDLLSANDRNGRSRLETTRLAIMKDEKVFPMPADGSGGQTARSNTDVANLASVLSKEIAQQNYIGSGYGVPITANGFSSNENTADKEPTAGKSTISVQDSHEVSFIYISPDIRRAIVNGDFVQEGEILNDGSQVVAIGSDAMIVEKDKKEYKLNVPKSLSKMRGR